jgi:hypothetical protein
MSECYDIDSPAVALTAGTAKTALLVTAAASQPFRAIQFTVGYDATAAGLLRVEFLVGTITGGTAGTAPNKARMNGSAYSRAPQATATMYTAEPTYTKHASNDALAIKTMIFPLPFAPYDIEYPLGREFYCPLSNVLAVRLLATTVSANAYVNLAIEE